jgi:hypothetical protein
MAKKAETSKLTFAELSTKPAGELVPYLVASVKVFGSLDAAKAKIEDSLQFDAKVVAAFQRLYTQRLNARDIPANTSFKEYLKQNAGGEVSGRVLAMATLFNTLCLTLDKNGKPMVPEENFDDAKVAWLEAANVIISAARKANGENWLTSDDVLDVVNALTKIGDAGKKLKAIRKRQKGEPADTAETGETAPVLTVGRAVEFLIAAIKNAGKIPQSDAADMFASTNRVVDAWCESGVSEDELNRWSANIANGVAVNLEIVTKASKAETPEAQKDDIAALVAA